MIAQDASTCGSAACSGCSWPVDVERVAGFLSQAVSWPDSRRVHHVRLKRLWPGKDPDRITFELEIELKSTQGTAAFCLQGGLGLGSQNRRVHTQARLAEEELLGIRVSDPAQDAWFCTPDRDWRLPAVRQLLKHTQLPRLLKDTRTASVLGLGDSSGCLQAEVIAYRATKRCVLRIRADSEDPNRSVFLKVFRRSPSEAHVSKLRTIAAELQAHSAGRVRVPILLDFLPAERILITAAVCDSSEILGAEAEDLHSAAQAMVALHQITSRVDGTHSPDDEVSIGRRWHRVLGLLSHPQCHRLGAIFDQLSERLPCCDPADTVLVHRDFYGRQLLRTDDVVWIVDLDTLCRTHAEVDLATYIAHLILERLQSGAAVTEAREVAARFAEQYRSCGGHPDESRLQFYLPAALARLGAIHAARGLPERIVGVLWDLSEQFMKSGCGA